MQNELVIKQIIDGLKRVHVDYESEWKRFVFNVGEAINNEAYEDLKIFIRIRKTPEGVRLAKSRLHNYAYVITIDIPETDPNSVDIQKILQGSEVSSGIDIAINSYKKLSGKSGGEGDSESDESDESEDRYNLEGNYKKLLATLNADILEAQDSIEELIKERNKSADPQRLTTLDIALRTIVNDQFGKNEDEFLKKVMKRPEAKFTSVMNKDEKDILSSRIKSFYRNKIIPLLPEKR